MDPEDSVQVFFNNVLNVAIGLTDSEKAVVDDIEVKVIFGANFDCKIDVL